MEAFFIYVKAILQEMQTFLPFLLLNRVKIYVIIHYTNIITLQSRSKL